MKPRLLFLALLCILLYGWYVLNSRQYHSVLDKALRQNSNKIPAIRASTAHPEFPDSLPQPPDGIAHANMW